MSIVGPLTDALAANALSSKPRQGRSLASFERMLSATKEILLERGSDDFTLQDVSERGNVSIGSIYLRFEGKDRLLHAVIANELDAIIAGERAMIDRLLERHSTLAEFLTAYIEQYSAFLKQQAQLLSTIMLRASIDPAVAGPGRETARRSADMSIDAILSFQDEITGDDPRVKAEAVFQIIFATIARQFGLGSTHESSNDNVWTLVREELAKMARAYLCFQH